MKKLDLYLASAACLLSGLWLKSSAVCISGVFLWAIAVAEGVLTKANKDSEIGDLITRMNKLEKDHKVLSADVINVAERAKTILGEVY